MTVEAESIGAYALDARETAVKRLASVISATTSGDESEFANELDNSDSYFVIRVHDSGDLLPTNLTFWLKRREREYNIHAWLRSAIAVELGLYECCYDAEVLRVRHA